MTITDLLLMAIVCGVLLLALAVDLAALLGMFHRRRWPSSDIG
jgi:hypothetical protein